MGGGSSRPLDKRWACLQKNFFGPFGPQFGLEIRWGGGGPRAPPLDPPPLLDPLQVLVMVVLFIDGISFRYTISHSSIEKLTS